MSQAFSTGPLSEPVKTRNDKEILVLCHRLPYPPTKGDKIRSYNILLQLRRWGWRIHLGSLIDDSEDNVYIETLKPLCASLKVVRISPWNKLRSICGACRGTSFSVEYFRNQELQNFVDSILSCSKIDAVLSVCAPMAEYVRMTPSPLPRRMVLDLMDVDSEKWLTYALRASWPMSWIYSLEGKMLSRYEEMSGALFGNVLLVSDAEASVMHPRVKSRFAVNSVSNGVDTEYFCKADEEVECSPLSMTFCGVMDYTPNVDAVCWFAEEVFTLIRKCLPEAEFWIVGSNPNSRVRALGSKPGIRVTGMVPDIRPYVWKSGVSVAPLRIARGVQNKVLEAMAMGKAVVVTPQALEGIEAERGVDVEVADDEPRVFADAVLNLLSDAEKRADMGRLARLRMEQTYSWEARLKPLQGLLA